MSEVADETEHLEMTAFASPPAGGSEHVMALVLVRREPRACDEVHDISFYSSPQRFILPRMMGTVGYRVEGDRVHLSVTQIENPRDASNNSGTLALELWALPVPYGGGSFQGVPLAGIAIGNLTGGGQFTNNSFDLPFSAPPAGRWHFVLMLREWTAGGYLTRDFCNFSLPVAYSSRAESHTTAVPQAKASPKEVSALRAQKIIIGAVAEKCTALEAFNSDLTQPRGPIPSEAPAVRQLLSINDAPEEELSSLDGLSPKLARAIINKRPFASVDDLRKVKGVSAKLLTVIRSRLKL
jgi:DNA uptake protein ComE-like DNA-binding protein